MSKVRNVKSCDKYEVQYLQGDYELHFGRRSAFRIVESNGTVHVHIVLAFLMVIVGATSSCLHATMGWNMNICSLLSIWILAALHRALSDDYGLFARG